MRFITLRQRKITRKSIFDLHNNDIEDGKIEMRIINLISPVISFYSPSLFTFVDNVADDE